MQVDLPQLGAINSCTRLRALRNGHETTRQLRCAIMSPRRAAYLAR